MKVGDTNALPIAELGKLTPIYETQVLVIDGLMQLQCESAGELNAWLTALQLLKSVRSAPRPDISCSGSFCRIRDSIAAFKKKNRLFGF